jgi:hypothetical protein
MPVQALTLIGFMTAQQAVGYLTNGSLFEDRSEEALLRHWETARANLGRPTVSAGCPDVRDIPIEHRQYTSFLTDDPQFVVGGAQLKLVEIEPLLAFQFHVELPRSEMLVANTSAPDLPEMLEICLPRQFETIPFRWTPQSNGVLIQSRSLNLRLQGTLDPQRMMAGIGFGPASPFVQVVRFDGRCYLRNGFHRTYGLGIRGATHVPCLYFETSDFAEVGARGGAGTFDRAILESEDPPTLGHYTRGCAYAVPLRVTQRIINVTWSEYAVPEEG